MAPPRSRTARDPHSTSPFVEKGEEAEVVEVRVAPGFTLSMRGRLLAHELMWISEPARFQSDVLRWLLGDEQYARVLEEYDRPLDGLMDDETIRELVSIGIEASTGLTVGAASGLCMAAARHWEAVCAKAGWGVDVGGMPARRFLALVVATLTDSETSRFTEVAREFTARLIATENDSQPAIRRKRRRRRKPRSQR